MRILARSAAALGATRFIDIECAHIDGCLYHGQASLDFVERLLRDGGRVAVPTTLNVGSLDLIHPELFRGSRAVEAQARRLMRAHVELGCEPTFTCAPYQMQRRPRFGQHIAWAESNAIVFANSVIGARTNRYGDFIDLCAAITGRVPYCGLHDPENRRGEIVFEVREFPANPDSRDVWYAMLGLVIGQESQGRIPVIAGLPENTNEDELKALGAASASTGSVALFHAVGITPEAPDLDAALGGRPPVSRVLVDSGRLRAARASINSAAPGDPLSAVSVGTPHFSLGEFAVLERLLDEAPGSLAVDFYVNTSRDTLLQLERSGSAARLREKGVAFVADTCTYITPILKRATGLVMTNSGKWAHYAPTNIGATVAYGSLRECVRSARSGRVCFDG